MGWNDKAPVPPTCPLIDQVVDKLEDMKLQHLMTELEYKNLHDLMEAIREANSTLRVWGNEQYTEAARLETANENLQRDIDKLERQVENLKDEVNELTTTL